MKTIFKLIIILIIFLITSQTDVPDRDFYLSQSSYALNSLSRNLNSPLLIFKEPTWNLISHFLSFFGNIESTFRYFSFFLYLGNAYIFSNILDKYLKFKNVNSYFYKFIFIFSPFFIAMNQYHLRQGAACLCFMLFVYFNLERNNYFIKFKDFSIIFFLLSVTIHLSYFFFIPFYLLSIIVRKLKFNKIRLVLVPISTFLLYVPTINLAYLIRADKAYGLTELSNSGIGFIFWFIWLLLLIQKGNLRKSYFSISLIVFYLITYFNFHYVGRIIQAFSPLIYIEASNMNLNQYKILGIIQFLFVVATLNRIF